MKINKKAIALVGVLALTVSVFASVLVGQNVVITQGGTPDEYAVWTCDDTKRSIVIDASYVILSGCVVDGSTSHGIRIGGEGHDVHHIIIENNTVKDSITENGVYPQCLSNAWGSGIKIALGAHDVIVRNNIVHDTCGEGIAVTRSSNVLIENNSAYNNWAGNIYSDASANVTISGNSVSCGATQIGSRLQFGIMNGHEYYAGWVGSRDSNKILGNTVSGCSDGINIFKQEAGAVNYNFTNAVIDGNTVIGTGRYSIHFSSGVVSQNVVVSNNRIFRAVSGALTGVTQLNNVIYNGPVITPTAMPQTPTGQPATNTPIPPTKTPTRTATTAPVVTGTATRTQTPTPTPIGSLYRCVIDASSFSCELEQ